MNKMNPRVKKVKALDSYQLELTFSNGEVKFFDMKPYLNTGRFAELKDENLFASVVSTMGSIQWQNGLDLCLDTLYEESEPYFIRQKIKDKSNPPSLKLRWTKKDKVIKRRQVSGIRRQEIRKP